MVIRLQLRQRDVQQRAEAGERREEAQHLPAACPQTQANWVDEVISQVPVRQWVLSLPIPLRVLLTAQPELVTPVLQVVQRVASRHLLDGGGPDTGWRRSASPGRPASARATRPSSGRRQQLYGRLIAHLGHRHKAGRHLYPR